MAKSVKTLLSDGRTPWFNVHSFFDEIEWSPEAYRVYGHLCRRAGQKITAFPSYSSIGRTCFKKAIASGHLSEKSARSKAIRAIKELLNLGMLRRDHRSCGKENESNMYTLTHSNEWTFLEKVVIPDNQGGDMTSPGVVIPDNQGGDMTSPKGIPIKVFQLEGSSPIVPATESEQIESEPCATDPIETAEKPASDQKPLASDPTAKEQDHPIPVKSEEDQAQDQSLGSKNNNIPPAECDTSDNTQDPAPWNFDSMGARYDQRPSPILEHYGLGYMAIARKRGRLVFAPQLIEGAREASKAWSNPLKLDGEVIAHLSKRVAQLNRENEYQSAIAFLEECWDKGERALRDAQERQEAYSIPKWVAPEYEPVEEHRLGFLQGKGPMADQIRVYTAQKAAKSGRGLKAS